MTHAALVSAADLRDRVLLYVQGRLNDGMHRAAKAHRLALSTISTRNIQWPQPD